MKHISLWEVECLTLDRVDVYTADYVECDLTISVKSSPLPVHRRN